MYFFFIYIYYLVIAIHSSYQLEILVTIENKLLAYYVIIIPAPKPEIK